MPTWGRNSARDQSIFEVGPVGEGCSAHVPLFFIYFFLFSLYHPYIELPQGISYSSIDYVDDVLFFLLFLLFLLLFSGHAHLHLLQL